MHEYCLAYFCYYVMFLIYYYHAWICCYVARLFVNMWLFIVILFLKFQNLQCLTNFLWNLKTNLNFLDLIFFFNSKNWSVLFRSDFFFNIKHICIFIKYRYDFFSLIQKIDLYFSDLIFLKKIQNWSVFSLNTDLVFLEKFSWL